MDQSQPNADRFQEALTHHMNGELDAAEHIYLALVDADAAHVDALTNLGALYLQRGEPAQAAQVLTRSIAHDAYQPNAHNLHGKAMQTMGRYEEALASYDSAIALSQKNAKYFADRGAVLFYLKKMDDAFLSYDAAIALDPRQPSYYTDRGAILLFLKRYEEALGYFDCALILDPNAADALNNRGNVLRNMKRYEEALASYNKVLALQPNAEDTHNNRGNVLRDLNRHAEAVAAFDRAIELRPDYAIAYSHRGLSLAALKRFDEALASQDRAIKLQPENGGAYWNKALLKLMLGDFKEGWPLYEWRWKSSTFQAIQRNFPQPLWLGDAPLAGKTILVHLEQGAGDSIQFSRYARLLEAQGAKVILEASMALAPVLRTISPTVTVVVNGAPLPPFDLHCPLMSLPLAMGTNSVAAIPHDVPYLSADPAKVSAWEARLGLKTKKRVGIVWSGTAKSMNDHNRSIPLNQLKALFDLPFTFHALQKEIQETDKETVQALAGKLHLHTKELGNYGDTAALVEAMDIVISVDTSVAHLAGAMAKPTWILLPSDPDFRWMIDREDSPWYPTARLFRQTQIADWSSVIDRVIEALNATA